MKGKSFCTLGASISILGTGRAITTEPVGDSAIAEFVSRTIAETTQTA